MPPHETPRETVEIRQEDAITIQDALTIAVEQQIPVGKSTLQRWAKSWCEQSNRAVRCILVTTRNGNVYQLHRDDFKAWLFEQQQNMRPREVLRDPMTPHETSRGLYGPREVLREEPRSEAADDELKKLRDDNMQLRIDVEVRKQLLNQAAGEMTRQRDQIEGLLRENGGLELQVRQLAAPKDYGGEQLSPPPRSASNTQQGDNQPDHETSTL